MPRPKKPQSPFRYFNSSPEVIRLVVLMYVRFCNGPSVKSPGESCRWLLASVRGQLRSCHIIRSEEGVSPSSRRRLQGSDCGHSGFTIFTVPAVGLRAGLAS
jgi:hypothetical protein